MKILQFAVAALLLFVNTVFAQQAPPPAWGTSSDRGANVSEIQVADQKDNGLKIVTCWV